MPAFIDPNMFSLIPEPQFSKLGETDTESELFEAMQVALAQGDEDKARELDIARRSLSAFKEPGLEVPTGESRLSADIRAESGAEVAPQRLIQDQEGSSFGSNLMELLSRRMGSPEAEALGDAGVARPPREADVEPVDQPVMSPVAEQEIGAPTEVPTVYVGRGRFFGSGATQAEAEASLQTRLDSGIEGVEGLTPGATGTLDIVPENFDVTLDPEGRGFVAGDPVDAEPNRIYPDEETKRLSEFIDAKLEIFDTKFSRDNYNKLTRSFSDDPKEMTTFNRGWIQQMALAEQDAGSSVKDLRSMRFKIDLGSSAQDILLGKARTQLTGDQQLKNTELSRITKDITALQKASREMRSPAPGTQRFKQKQSLDAQIAAQQRRADDIRSQLNLGNVATPTGSDTTASSFLKQFPF